MSSQLTDLTGVGPSTAKTLLEHGYKSLQAVADANIESLSQVPGFGAARAEKCIAEAKTFVAAKEPETPIITNQQIQTPAAKPAQEPKHKKKDKEKKSKDKKVKQKDKKGKDKKGKDKKKDKKKHKNKGKQKGKDKKDKSKK